MPTRVDDIIDELVKLSNDWTRTIGGVAYNSKTYAITAEYAGRVKEWVLYHPGNAGPEWITTAPMSDAPAKVAAWFDEKIRQ